MAANGEDGKLFEIRPQDEVRLPEGEIKTAADVQDLHRKMIEVQRERVNRALKAEREQGGGLDRHASTELRRLDRMISSHHQLFEPEQPKPKQCPGIVAEMLASVFDQKPRKNRAEPVTRLS